MTISVSQTGYVPVNGLDMYYEITGTGEPLVLLHGGMGSTGTFAALVPALAAERQVIAFDLQAHGRTADIDRPLRYGLMADDVADALRSLGIARADLLGYSLGGGTALQVAIRRADIVRRLVLVSTPFRRAAWYPEILAGMAQLGPATAEMMKPTPLYRNYAALAPRPDDWPTLHVKLKELLTRDYDWTQEVAAIRAPTLFVAGDGDSFSPSHAVEFFALLGGGRKDGGWDGSGLPASRLAILPAQTHYDPLSSPLLADVVRSFLGIAMAD
ncbi:MAG TPA: alpha/beta fold hydrolase [Aliidongia sp.]|uniref:alpha/beta fold hydrolase n=1 Tax=Aliidongia sp. TaxID=1914230 RepID=UPI002DDD6DD8|nr:alpha/beta fold hydrolase [Aliidongia sp.]HEV2675343.1 alpha/beta fold hydrolase [Aliidongia sp.]